MKSTILFAVVFAISSFSFATTTQEASQCVLQINKVTESTPVAEMIIVCEGNTLIAQHALPSYGEIEDKDTFHADLLGALKTMMEGETDCQSIDAETIWFGVCLRK